MTQRLPTPTIFIACTMMAFSACADAAVVQCLDLAGVTTFTDAPCKVAEDAARAASAIPNARAKTVTLKTAISVTAENARASAWASKREPHRGLASDVATMKAARASMVSMDEATAVARRQSLAGL